MTQATKYNDSIKTSNQGRYTKVKEALYHYSKEKGTNFREKSYTREEMNTIKSEIRTKMKKRWRGVVLKTIVTIVLLVLILSCLWYVFSS